MADLQIRAMTQDEFNVYRRRAICEYAAEHVRVGDWSREDAEGLATKETDDLLPDGVDTAGMALLAAEVDGEHIGLVWLGRAPGQQVGWWIYDIEVDSAQRRRGYGRALLEAAEREAKRRDGESIGLKVFGHNNAACRLYESSGYQVSSILMRKRLTSQSVPPR